MPSRTREGEEEGCQSIYDSMGPKGLVEWSKPNRMRKNDGVELKGGVYFLD